MLQRTLAFLSIFCIITCCTANGQKRDVVIKHGDGKGVLRGDADVELLHIPELSAMIAENGGGVTIDRIMEPAMRAKGYEQTEVKEGDMILMVNGKKISTLSVLKELYNSASTGSTMKLGIKRNDEMMIASFVKADPSTMPHMRMMISKDDEGDFLGIPQVGLRFTSKGKDVVIKEVLPNAATVLQGVDVKEGDVVTALNASPIKSFKVFETLYQKIRVGDRVEMTVGRGDKTMKIVFSKPENNGRVMIRRERKQ